MANKQVRNMQIRFARMNDSDVIKTLYLQTFNKSEADLVSNLAVNFLVEESTVDTMSLVATDNDVIIGHIAFSPVFLDSSNEHIGYILAPLAVSPAHQNNRVGTTIVENGLDTISSLDTGIVFVYGDPQYYSRFGFKTILAQKFPAPYPLHYPDGWQALNLNSAISPDSGEIKCVNSLSDPELW